MIGTTKRTINIIINHYLNIIPYNSIRKVLIHPKDVISLVVHILCQSTNIWRIDCCNKICVFNFWTNTWSKHNVKSYMHSVGISDQYYKPHIFEVHNCTSNIELSLIDKIQRLHIPTMWTSTSKLKQYIDTPIHLIFQGIVKSVIEFCFCF